MKYYAVTDDPNELLHYGRLGMKWGQHIFVGPKSLSYKKAEGKLRNKIQQVKQQHQIHKAVRDMKRQQKQQEKFNKAVQKSQQRIALSEGFSNIDKLTSYEKSDRQAFKTERKLQKYADKQAKVNAKNELRFAKNEPKMDKYLQMARQNKLKYGGLSTDQIMSINSRLNLEASTRRLGGAEETFRHRSKEAFKEGVLQGITQGTAAGMREIAIAKVQNRLKNKAQLDKKSESEAKRQKEATRIKNSRTRGEIRKDIREEAYESSVRSGEGMLARNRVLHPLYNLNGGKHLQTLDDKNREHKRLQENETKRRNEIDARWQQYLDEGGVESVRSRIIKKRIDLSSGSKHFKNDSAGLYEARQKRLAALGYSEKNIKERQDEQKRNKDSEAKNRNDIDERWRKYLDDGGQESFTTIDQNGRLTSIIDGSSGGINKNSPSKLYEAREQILRSYEKTKETQEEAKNKAAYDKEQAKEVARIEQERQEKAWEDHEKRYERLQKKYKEDQAKDAEERAQYAADVTDIKKYNKELADDYNKKVSFEKVFGGDPNSVPKPNYKPLPPQPNYRNTPKPPSFDDYTKANPPKYDISDLKNLPSYEDAKRLRSIGLPGPLGNSNNQQSKKKQNQQNKGGR